jgi:hypothetical protein
MTQKLRLTILVAFAALVAAPAAAQERAQGPRVGIGASLSSLELGSVVSGGLAPMQIYVPIFLSPNLRVEPQLGLIAANGDGADFHQLDLGAGVLFGFVNAPQFNGYVGPRLVLSFVGDEQNFGGGLRRDTSGINLGLLGVVGGEWFPSPRFSLGVEGQLGLTFVGDRNVDDAPDIEGGSVLRTGALLFFRTYLF